MSDALRLKTTNFAAVDGAPIDRVARRVAGEGEHWDPLRKMGSATRIFSETPLPVFRYEVPTTCPNAGDLTGFSVGRLKVIGYGGSSGGANWVVRCSCGNYEHRKRKFLKSEAANESEWAMCLRCRYVEKLKVGKPPSIHPRKIWKRNSGWKVVRSPNV